MSSNQQPWRQVKISDLLTEHSDRAATSNQHEVLSVTKDGIVSQQEYFNKQIASKDNSGYKIVKRGDVVFSAMNLWMGSIDVVKNHEIGIVSPAYITMRPNERLVDADFLSYFLRGEAMRGKYVHHSQQGASIVRRNLNKDDLLNDEIAIPPLPEQKKIAEMLSGIDKEIFIHVHKLEGLSMLFRNLLGEHFLERCKSSDLCLEDVICAPIQYGANASAVKLRTGQPRYIRITDIKEDGTLNESNAVGIDLAFGDCQGYLLRQGDLLLARTGNTVGKSYLHSNSGEEMVFAGYMLRVALNENAYRPEYLFLFTKCDIYKSWISEASRAGAQPNINAKEYGAMVIPDTSMEDQVAFTKRALSINQAMRQLEKKVNKLQFLRQSLSADLLSGRKRVTL